MASESEELPEAYQGEEPYIFVSYKHEDGAKVYPLVRELNELGYRVWYDEGIPPSKDYRKEIANALIKSDLFLVCMTAQALESEWVMNEINMACDERKPFLAIHLEELKLPPELRLQIGRFQAVWKWKLSPSDYRRSLGRALPAPLRRAPVVETKPTPPTSAPAGISKLSPAETPKPAPAAPVEAVRVQPVVIPKPIPPPAQLAARRAGETDAMDLGGGVKIDLVWCPPGSFLMGSPDCEAGRFDDEAQHRVTLTRGFWMGKYPVTQRQWEAVMGVTPSRFKDAGPDAPVETVNWDDCKAFVRKLHKKLAARGDVRSLDGGTFSLPTEAEWEYACRAGAVGPYAGNLDDMAWYCENSGSTTHPVGQKRPNAWGLHDMHGNVWEWCQSGYGSYPLGSVTDPAGPGSGSNRVRRGGGWNDYARYCRSAVRFSFAPGDRFFNLGLRLVRSAP